MKTNLTTMLIAGAMSFTSLTIYAGNPKKPKVEKDHLCYIQGRLEMRAYGDGTTDLICYFLAAGVCYAIPCSGSTSIPAGIKKEGTRPVEHNAEEGHNYIYIRNNEEDGWIVREYTDELAIKVSEETVTITLKP